MGIDRREEEQRRLLAEAVRYSRITVGDLWLRYFSLAGDAGEYEVDAYLNGSLSLPALQRDLLAQAANELIDEQPPPPRAPYVDEMGQRMLRRQQNASGNGPE
jgi:hypothetical protein